MPSQGAGKEYIGDDIEEMVVAVRGAIQVCVGFELKVRLEQLKPSRSGRV